MIDELIAFVNGNPVKTLDVQIAEQTAALGASIDGMESGLQASIGDMSEYLSEYVLEPSDEVYLETDISYEWVKADGNVSELTIPGKIVFNTSGSVKLTFNYTRSSTDLTNRLYVYKNSTQLLSVYASYSEPLIITDIKKGDIITFKLSATTNSYSGLWLKLSDVNVLASTIYARTLNLIEVTGV